MVKLIVAKAETTGKTYNGLSYFVGFVRAVNLRHIGIVFILQVLQICYVPFSPWGKGLLDNGEGVTLC